MEPQAQRGAWHHMARQLGHTSCLPPAYLPRYTVATRISLGGGLEDLDVTLEVRRTATLASIHKVLRLSVQAATRKEAPFQGYARTRSHPYVII